MILNKNSNVKKDNENIKFPIGVLFKLILLEVNPITVLGHLLLYLNSEKSNPNIIYNNVPLLHAACSAVSNPILFTQLLLDYKADPNIQSREVMQQTTLHFVCTLRFSTDTLTQIQLLKLLLKAKADPNLVNSFEQMPLLYYCAGSSVNKEGLKLLLEYKADPNVVVKELGTPLECLLLKSPVVVEHIKIFFDYKFDPNKRNHQLKSTFFHTLCNNDLIKDDMLTYFIERGTDTVIKNQVGFTPVHYYLQRKENIRYDVFLGLVKHFKESDFKVNKNKDVSLLYLACKNTAISADIVRFLLEKAMVPQFPFIEFYQYIKHHAPHRELVIKQTLIENDDDWKNLVAMQPNSVETVKQKKNFYVFLHVDSSEKKNSILHIQIANSFDGSMTFHNCSKHLNGAKELLDYIDSKQSSTTKSSLHKPYQEPMLFIQNAQGETPLLLALKTINSAYTLCLLKLDKSSKTIHLADKDQRTPLHIAYLFGMDELADALLKRRASEDVVDKYGKKPQDYLLCDKEDKKKYIEEVLDSIGFFKGAVFQEKDKEMVVNCLLEKNQQLQAMLFPKVELIN